MCSQRNVRVGHLSARTRLDIVRELQGGRKTQVQIAAEFHCTQQAVSKIWQHHLAFGDTVERHGGGRPRAFSDDHLQILSSLIEESPSATAHHLNELLPADAPRVSDRAIRKYRRQLDFTRRVPPVEVINIEHQLADRRAWARAHRHLAASNYVFMDESTLMLRDTGRWVWVRRGNPTPTHEVEGLKFAVHVWGAIWNDGALFQQYRGWLTADRYTEILKHNILANKRRFRGKTILHDGAPSHRAKLTQEWLNENQLAVEFTPPHSPQFNAIEYAWAWLKAQVRDTEPHSDADLKESMKLACQLLPANVRQNYIAHACRNILAEAAV
jgi:transposase